MGVVITVHQDAFLVMEQPALCVIKATSLSMEAAKNAVALSLFAQNAHLPLLVRNVILLNSCPPPLGNVLVLLALTHHMTLPKINVSVKLVYINTIKPVANAQM